VYERSEITGYDWKLSPQGAPDGFTLHWGGLPSSGRRMQSQSSAAAATPTELRVRVQAEITMGWLGLGFSTNGQMVGSDAVIGWMDASSGVPSVGFYALDGQATGAIRKIENVLSASSLTTQTVNNKRVYTMEFTRPWCITDGSQQRCLSATSSALLWAMGDMSRISFHTRRGSFTVALDGSSAADRLGISDRQYQRLAHAICMLLGWGVLLPFGASVAAGLRDRLGAPLWFRIHLGCQLAGLVIAISGVCIALVHFGPVSEYGNHGKMGLAVMVLGILQPINGILRPPATKYGEGKTPRRRAWEVLHKGSGWLALILALPTMALGAQLLRDRSEADFPGAATAITAIFITVAAISGLLVMRGYCYLGSAASQLAERKEQFQPSPQA